MTNHKPNFSRVLSSLDESLTENSWENDSTYGPDLNLWIREKENCLPFMWCVRFSKIENKGSNENENICNTRFVCEGVLCYENGEPLSFKNMGFSVINYQKCLPNFCYICGTTKFLKFRVDFDRDSVISNGNRLKEVEIAFLQAQITYKLTENQNSVNSFLLKMGLISPKGKSLNRYRNILMSQSLLKEMKKILSQHSHLNTNNEMEDSEMKEEMKESLENKEKSNEKERPCCCNDLPKKQSEFPIINSENNQMIKVHRMDIFECCETFDGGYFNVQSWNTHIETFVPDSSIDSEIFSINKRQKYKFQKKIAIKKLKKEVSEENTKKYASKLQHEISIIKQIGKNENVCKYYDLPETISSISTEDGRSMIDNELSSTINQSSSSMFDEAEEGKSESSTVEEMFKPFQHQSKTIIMENLSFSLQHVLKKNPLCNLFQLIKQLVNSVKNLHQSGIVHRDIKPANIMFNDRGLLKLIDFSESVECWRYFEENRTFNLGFTLPYSPFECATTSSDGFANPKIDNWSIGMVISEILLGEIPVCYSKMMAGNFKEGGQSELHWCYNLRVNSFHDSILFPLKILCLSLLKSEPSQRLCLTSIAKFLSFYESLA